MASFTFGDENAVTNAGNDARGKDGGEAGSNSGATNAEGSDNGIADGDNGATEQAADPNAPLGYLPNGQPRKRRYSRRRRSAASAEGTGSEEGSRDGLAVKNDREKVIQNITGLHLMAAVVTKQQILILTQDEATRLGNSLCDVADYHNINLITAGGAFGLYAALATTAYAIYVPRFQKIKEDRAAENAKQANPDYREESPRDFQFRGPGKMDFSGDTTH